MIKGRRTWIGETGETLTYEIDIQEAFKEYKNNKEFRDYLSAGHFIHCENRFVINHSKYVRIKQEGGAELTEYAKLNEKECCVVFALETPKCYVCGKEAAALCDYPSCDRPLCAEHRTRIGYNTDVCPEHSNEVDIEAARENGNQSL